MNDPVQESKITLFRVSNLIVIVTLFVMRRPLVSVIKSSIRLAAVLVRPTLFVFGIAKALGLVGKRGAGATSIKSDLLKADG